MRLELQSIHAKRCIELVWEKAKLACLIHPETVTNENAVKAVQVLQSVIVDLAKAYEQALLPLVRDGLHGNDSQRPDRHSP